MHNLSSYCHVSLYILHVLSTTSMCETVGINPLLYMYPPHKHTFISQISMFTLRQCFNDQLCSLQHQIAREGVPMTKNQMIVTMCLLMTTGKRQNTVEVVLILNRQIKIKYTWQKEVIFLYQSMGADLKSSFGIKNWLVFCC